MSSIGSARSSSTESSDVATDANHVLDAVSAGRVRDLSRLLFAVLGAASLAACAQSNVGPGRQASLHPDRTASVVTYRRVATARHTPYARHHHAHPTQLASRGVASFYTEPQETANGEQFDTNELTAAHRTLPFGTRLRVTNVTTGKSVVVRINDRGPYIPGRVVDVSHSAASELGMVDSGIAKVKLDVVQ